MIETVAGAFGFIEQMDVEILFGGPMAIIVVSVFVAVV
jgi:hypothetical protein